LTTAGHHMGI